MLTQKAKELGLSNTKYYVDDGYTGTNFNRPAFQELLDDIEMGYISVVIVKDLSRLGRDYVSVGHYTDNYFPEHNVRFIAVNDMVDSDEGENEIAPFKNVMNEMYARDISRKVRSAHRIRGNMGEPLSQPPYGYMKDPQNKKKWIIDTESAEVVKSIFAMCIEGNADLYEALKHKTNHTIYNVKFSKLANILIDKQCEFEGLSLYEQCYILMQIINILHANVMSGDLSAIGEAKKSGVTTISNKMQPSYKTVKLINQSISGLFEQEIDLLK